MNHLRIDRETALKLIREESAVVLDIRDQTSFASGHITGARRLDNRNVSEFIATANRATPVIVCCYHGNASQGAAQFLSAQGFNSCYSLDGGFQDWHMAGYPCASGVGS